MLYHPIPMSHFKKYLTKWKIFAYVWRDKRTSWMRNSSISFFYSFLTLFLSSENRIGLSGGTVVDLKKDTCNLSGGKTRI
jgi:hypothetical protein